MRAPRRLDRLAPHLQFQRLHRIANNGRFLLLFPVRIPHLASRLLALNLRRLSQDWQAACGHPLLLAKTFVDPARSPRLLQLLQTQSDLFERGLLFPGLLEAYQNDVSRREELRTEPERKRAAIADL